MSGPSLVCAFIRLHRDDFRDDRICVAVSDAGSANSQRTGRNHFKHRGSCCHQTVMSCLSPGSGEEDVITQ